MDSASSSSHTSPLNNSEAQMKTGEAQRITAAASKTFKQVVSVKLDDTNYLQWKQQVEGVLRGTKMVRYVVSPQIPPVFLSDVAREAGTENPAYTEWEEQRFLVVHMDSFHHLPLLACAFRSPASFASGLGCYSQLLLYLDANSF